MTGDTPVLMGDGVEKPLRDVRSGDMVATIRPTGHQVAVVAVVAVATMLVMAATAAQVAHMAAVAAVAVRQALEIQGVAVEPVEMVYWSQSHGERFKK